MRILLAVDGSRYSADVVDAVLSRSETGLVRVLSAVDPEQSLVTDSSGPDLSGTASQTPIKATEELVDWVADSLASHGFDAETAVKPGDPREVIVTEAENWQADLIVMGAYGHSGVRSRQIGSVAESVARHARSMLRRAGTKAKERLKMSNKNRMLVLLGIALVAVVRTWWKKSGKNSSDLRERVGAWENEGGQVPQVTPTRTGR